MNKCWLIIGVILITLILGCSRQPTVTQDDLKEKYAKTAELLKQKQAEGYDVASLESDLARARALGEEGKLKETNRILDEVYKKAQNLKKSIVINTTTPPLDVSPEPPPPLAPSSKLFFYEGFEAGKVGSGWTGGAFKPLTQPFEDSDSIDIVTSPVRKGSYALKITVHPEDAVTQGDAVVDKERAELLRQNTCRSGSCKLGDEGKEGAELWYAWSVFMPEDYVYTSTSGNFQIMGQWHDQPAAGEEPSGFSPPISVNYLSDGTKSEFRISYGLINLGQPDQKFRVPIELGKWIDLMFHIRFSQGNDGFLEFWKDGQTVISTQGAARITGPNMYNAEPDYLRIGLYRGKGQTQVNTIYYDEIKIGTTKEQVLS